MPVERPTRVVARGQGRERCRVRLELEEYTARVVQHELDHLDGVLIIDRTDDEHRKEALATCGRASSCGEGRLRGHRAARRRRPRAARRHARRSRTCSRVPTRRGGAAASSRRRPRRWPRERLGIPVHQPERAGAARAGRARGRLRVRPLHPAAAARAVAVAERASVAAAALARRGAGRARDPRRRRGDGRDDPRDGRRARRRADRGAGAVRDRRRSTRAACSCAPARSPRGCSTTCSPIPCSSRSASEATYAEKITPADRELDLADPLDAWRRVRALSPHIGARGELHGPPRDDLERAARGRRARAGGRPARGARADELRRVPARPAVIAPARRAAFDVVRRVFEQDAYADRALASAVEGLDARDRALAQRLAFGTVQRVRDARLRDRAAREAAGAQARPAGARVAAARRLPARVHRPGRARGRRRRRRARPRRRRERAVPFTNAVMRRLASGLRGLVASLPEGPVKESYPDWIAEIVGARLRRRGGARADARAERAAGARGALADSPVGEPTDVPGAYAVERVDPRADAADEPRVAARGARRRLRGRASAILDACAAPGGKSAMLAAAR